MLSVTVRWDHSAMKRMDGRLAKYQGAPLEKRVTVSLQAATRPLAAKLRAAEKSSGIKNQTQSHYRSIKVRKARKRPGEMAAYTAGPTDRKRHLLIRGHRVVTRLHRDTGFRARAFPYVDRVIESESPEIMGKLGRDVWSV